MCGCTHILYLIVSSSKSTAIKKNGLFIVTQSLLQLLYLCVHVHGLLDTQAENLMLPRTYILFAFTTAFLIRIHLNSTVYHMIDVHYTLGNDPVVQTTRVD